MLLAAITVGCAVLVGFAAHRASLCNVRAVAEVLTSGSAHMLWSLIQAVLWMTMLTGVLVTGIGMAPHPVAARLPVAWPLVGGLLFGAGAAINGGCSLSTVTRLSDGDLGMVATLAGFIAGVGVWIGLLTLDLPHQLASVASPWLRWPRLAPWLTALLLAGALHRITVIWAMGAGRPARWRAILAPHYSLSAAAALLGLASGLLYATQGSWSYTNYLRSGVLHAVGIDAIPTAWHGILVIALLGGMVTSAVQRRSFGWRRPATSGGWLRHAGGGTLMGTGASMVPGGNDTILLGGLSGMTGASVATYSAMLAGIAIGLALMRASGIRMPAMVCSPSGCDESRATPPISRS